MERCTLDKHTATAAASRSHLSPASPGVAAGVSCPRRTPSVISPPPMCRQQGERVSEAPVSLLVRRVPVYEHRTASRLLRSIRAIVIDYNDLKVDLAARGKANYIEEAAYVFSTLRRG